MCDMEKEDVTWEEAEDFLITGLNDTLRMLEDTIKKLKSEQEVFNTVNILMSSYRAGRFLILELFRKTNSDSLREREIEIIDEFFGGLIINAEDGNFETDVEFKVYKMKQDIKKFMLN